MKCLTVLITTTLIIFATDNLFAQADMGNAGLELSRIKSRAIGRGYSVDSLNRMTMRTLKPQVRVPGTSNLIGTSLPGIQGGSQLPSAHRQAATFDSFGPTLNSSQKPFANVQTSPTVSPYLNLFNDGILGVEDNYNTIVRPQLQQQQINQQVSRQAEALNRQVQQLSARPAFNPAGSQRYSPTGHSTGFMYYSHFYPSAGRRR